MNGADYAPRNPLIHFPQSTSASRVTAAASGVLHFEPIFRAAGAVARAEPLRYDALHDRERTPVSASAMSGKRRVMSLPGRL
jgi:hypothetical protein